MSALPANAVKYDVKARTTSGTPGTADTFDVPIPPNAVALVGAGIGNVVSTITQYGLFVCSVTDTLQTSATQGDVVSFTFAAGNKLAVGCFPVDPKLMRLQVTVTFVADASVAYRPLFYFLIGPAGTVVTPGPLIPNGGYDSICMLPSTSAVTTAQTVTVTPIGTRDYIEVLAVWFYTSSTATGNIGYWDGVTRVDFDSTAAVATYVFNMGKTGSRTAFTSGAVNATSSIRVVIGAPGASTTTVNILYRASVMR